MNNESNLTTRSLIAMDESLEVGNKLSKMALGDDEPLSLHDKLDILKVAATFHRNAIDAARVVVANDTLRHKIFHDNRLLDDGS